MSNFSYSQYQNVVEKAKSSEASNSGTKIGFFKLSEDKEEALVRFNVNSLDSLQFATIHQLGASTKWMKVSCLNPVGSYDNSCPFCAAVAGGDKNIGKAAKRVFVQLMVSYKDTATGQWAAAIPVIWERPAGFSRELATMLNDYGALTEKVFKITRNGAKGDVKTTYSVSYIPLFDNPDTVSNDFSAFTNFNIAKHSYWEKTADEINTFLNTGSFPEVVRNNAATSEIKQPTQTVAQVATTYSTPVQAAPQTFATPVNVPPVIQPVTQPTAAPVEPSVTAPAAHTTTIPSEDRPGRQFKGFSF